VIAPPPLARHGHEAQCLRFLRDAAQSGLWGFYGSVVNDDKQGKRKKIYII